MPSPTFVLGVGGTGLRGLLHVKERFIEAYDKLPKEVILLELDTDNYQGETRESFNGVRLNSLGDVIGNHQILNEDVEFYWVRSGNNTQKIDSIFQKNDPEWQWVDRIRMNRTIAQPGNETISSGARTIRPIGRAALFMDYQNVYQILTARINKLAEIIQSYPQADTVNQRYEKKEGKLYNKGQIFVISSIAGGAGSGMTLDILRMIEHIRKAKELPITVNCLLVGGSCFVKANDGQRTLSNTFAALRELDRFGAIAGKMIVKAVPSVIVAPRPVGRFQSTIGPADNIYFFDRPDRNGRTRNLDNYGEFFLNQVMNPTIADFIVALADSQFTPKFESLNADLSENTKRGPKGEKGHYPYMSAGIHSLIFPERDIRWSAGFKLLNAIWDEYLVRPNDVERHHIQGADLLPISANLWGTEEQGVKVSQLVPYVFAKVGFQRDTVCGKVANNSFINTVVRSALQSEITLPPKYPNILSYFTRGRTNLARVWALVGIPSKSKDTYDHLAERGERVAEWFDKKIDQLDRTNNHNDIDRWKITNWGPGPVGAEELDNGEWIAYLEKDEIICRHKQEFASVIADVVEEILNDKDENGRILAFRLEYARRMLDCMNQMLDIWLHSKDGRGGRSLLVEYFDKDIRKETEKRQKLAAIDPNKDFNKYKIAMVDYARARREVFAKELLALLCNELKNVIAKLSTELDDWRNFLRQAGKEIQKKQDEHENNRRKKAQINVRTYITDNTFENSLFDQYKDSASNLFRKAIYWSRDGKDGFYLMNTVFSKSVPTLPDNPTLEQLELVKKHILLTPGETADRAIRWACTTAGNPDRQDEAAQAPLRKLASNDEIDIASRITDYFGSGNVQTLVTKLTHEAQIACLCPIKSWPASRLIFACSLPRFSSNSSNKFYDEAFRGIAAQTSSGFNDRKIIHDITENPRHAFAIEIATGFRLQDRTDYDMYLHAYLEDCAAMYALHCLPEESTASTFFEQTINAERKPGELLKIFNDLNIQHKMQLDPAIVDILRDRNRLEFFVKARALGFIQTKEDGDLYLYPNVKNGDYRLSKMSTTEDRDKILSDLVYDVRQLAILHQNPQIANRMRLFYALRTFVLLEHDLENENRGIDFARLKRDIEAEEATIKPDILLGGYEKLVINYKNFYDEYGEQENLNILAHLGLVLSLVAFDCCKKIKTDY